MYSIVIHPALSPQVCPRGAVLVVGFEDGVVRLLELSRSASLQAVPEQSQNKDAELCLRQALKPHNAPVTAIAYECNGEILATAVRE